uniref:Uncharacterized protein n=1 Tax=Coccidioides posadasii RMSCC 3488 TaxID=454284 RepID=A0A0J6F0Z6_COCPO|nr:hypothetical protein CPAG_00092 [Coccidioides posadasii RMSCC 3488]
MRRLKSLGHKKDQGGGHDRTSKHRPKGLMTGPGSHFSTSRSGRTAAETHDASARERRPTLTEEQSAGGLAGPERQVSDEAHPETMAVGTTQVNGTTSAEETQPTTEAEPARPRSVSVSGPAQASGPNNQQRAFPSLRSSRGRSLGVHDEQGAAVAAAASAYCTKEKVSKRATGQQPPPAAEAVQEERCGEHEKVGTTGGVDEKYDRAAWEDDEIIESGGLSSALPANPGVDEEEEWDLPASISTPAVITTAEAERPALARAPSPRRSETLVIGNATEIPYVSTEEQAAAPVQVGGREGGEGGVGVGSARGAEGVGRQQPQPASMIPVYLLAAQQAEAERAVLEAHKSRPEALTTEQKEAKEKEEPRVILACECAVLQAEAEAELAQRQKRRISGRIPEASGEEKPGQLPEQFRGEERPGAVPGTREPAREAERTEESKRFREGDKEAGLVAGVGQPPRKESDREEIPEQFRAETPGQPVEERPQAPVQERVAGMAPGVEEPVEAVPPPHEGEEAHKQSRWARRRAEKDAKALEKKRQREEKDRQKEEKRRQREAVKQQLGEQKESRTAEPGRPERRDSKMEEDRGFFNKILRRASTKQSGVGDTGAAGGGSGGNVEGGGQVGGQQTGTTTTAADNTTANQPAVLAS